MNCNAVPYEGKEKYVFISYCHEDEWRVYPILEEMARRGCRLWYDKGIVAGDEWPDVIAQHLLGCEVCLFLLSPAYVNSNNCRQEQTYAVTHQKKILCVRLEETALPIGMQMQLSRSQYINWSRDAGDGFYSNLLRAAADCVGPEDPSIRVQQIVSPGEKNPGPEPPGGGVDIGPGPVGPRGPKGPEEPPGGTGGEEGKTGGSNGWGQETIVDGGGKGKNPEGPGMGSETISVYPVDPGGGVTTIPQMNVRVLLVDPETGAYVLMDRVETVIGRERADFLVDKERKQVGRKHCRILWKKEEYTKEMRSANGAIYMVDTREKYYIQDMKSANGTWVDGIRLGLSASGDGELKELPPVSLLSLAGKNGYRLIAAVGEEAKRLEEAGEISLLISREFGGALFLREATEELGRGNPWPCGAMTNERISRDHAEIVCQEGRWRLFDHSSNHTYLNGREIDHAEAELKDGDTLRLGGEHLLFRTIRLKKEGEEGKEEPPQADPPAAGEDGAAPTDANGRRRRRKIH